MFTIKSRWSGEPLHEVDAESLRDAVIRLVAQRADLRGADLRGANLRGADLRGADLRGANLRGANLGDVDLRGANLRGANLGDADLRGANLGDVRSDLIYEILKLPGELENLCSVLLSGKINGSSYTGECACLAGTIANHRGISVGDGSVISDNGCAFTVDSSSPRERWFLAIKPGGTPDNSQISAITVDWVREAIAIRDHIRATGGNSDAMPKL